MKSTTSTNYSPTLKVAYQQKARFKLKQELGLKNLHQVPVLEKIVLNVGIGRFKSDKQVLATSNNTLIKITAQKPQATLARMSIANFKLRTGNQIGWRVTLRGDRMYEFLERLIDLVMPRLRDFRGASLKSFDKQGNYSLGFREQAFFPELSFAETNPSHGLQATFVFHNSNPVASRRLLEEFGFKFEKRANKGVSNG